MDNQPAFDRSILIPILLGGFSVIGIIVVLLIGRSLSAPPEIPVIIFSGLRSESADLETIRPNTRLVEKPYSLVMLMDTLEDMLEQSRGNSSGFGRIAAS